MGKLLASKSRKGSSNLPTPAISDEQKIQEVEDALDGIAPIAYLTFTTDHWPLQYRHIGLGYSSCIIEIPDSIFSTDKIRLTCKCGKEFIIKGTCTREIEIWGRADVVER